MKVSILIPAYNSELTIATTLDSVLSQSYKDLEVIIVDDGSTDATLDVLEQYRKVLPLKIITQENGGACKARNRAFTESSGNFIQYLDADDVLSPDKIKNQIERTVTAGTDCVMTSSWCRFYNDNELATVSPRPSFLDQDWPNPIEWLCASWAGKGMGQTSIWLTPRHLIEKAGPWNESLSINQDGEFFCRVVLASQALLYCKGAIVYYRSGDSSSVSQKKSRRKTEDLLHSYYLYENHVIQYEDSSRIRNALAFVFATFIYENYDAHPDLVAKARSKMEALHVLKYPSVGGRQFRRLSSIIGFKNALLLRSWIARMMS